ncbi:MAG: XdhC family protein [Brotaphodocola sp.]
MKKIIDILVKRMEAGKDSILVTIVQSKGSAPRAMGAAMLVGEDGYLCGTIGGGMLEYRATNLAREDLKNKQGILRKYRLTKEEVAGLGMVCGGDVDILFTFLQPSEENKKVVMTIQDCMNRYEKIWLMLPLDGNSIGFARQGEGNACPMGDGDAKNGGQKEHALIEDAFGKKVYVRCLENASRVYVFGGGHLAQELVPVISHLGFRCVVTDDREEFSTRQLFPDAEEVHTMQFDQLEGKFDIYENDYIIAVTRGHMGDLDVQKFALKTPAYYIGVVGSRSKIKTVNEKLREAGYTEEDINRVVTPIGLDIHSETPAEIAISIAAQLIEKRALKRHAERKS